MELRPSDYQITGVERFPDKFLFGRPVISVYAGISDAALKSMPITCCRKENAVALSFSIRVNAPERDIVQGSAFATERNDIDRS